MWQRKNDVISEKLHLHFLGEWAYSKLDRVKTMGTREKINAIWWNLQKLVDTCGYELPTILQNFTHKHLTKVKIFQNVLGGATFFETPCIALQATETIKCGLILIWYLVLFSSHLMLKNITTLKSRLEVTQA